MNRLYGSARIGVLMGGWSNEHDVSLGTGAAVTEALRARGYEVVPITIASDALADNCHLLETLRSARVDVVFIALHGRLAEDGCIQDQEIAGIPCGASPFERARDG